MTAVVEPPRWLERWSRRRILRAAAGSTGLALIGTAFAPPLGDAILVSLGAGLIALAGWAWRRRRALDELPLVLGKTAVRQVVGGVATLRLRVWLGHGRVMRGIEARAVLRTPEGRELPVVVEVPVEVATGPLTLTAVLPPLARGALTVDAQVVEAGRVLAATRSFEVAKAPSGPLDAPIRGAPGETRWDRAAWDRPLSGR